MQLAREEPVALVDVSNPVSLISYLIPLSALHILMILFFLRFLGPAYPPAFVWMVHFGQIFLLSALYLFVPITGVLLFVFSILSFLLDTICLLFLYRGTLSQKLLYWLAVNVVNILSVLSVTAFFTSLFPGYALYTVETWRQLPGALARDGSRRSVAGLYGIISVVCGAPLPSYRTAPWRRMVHLEHMDAAFFRFSVSRG